MVRERLRAEPRQDPHHRVRVRRHPYPQRVAAGPGRGQDVLRRAVHPGGHVLDRRVPAQHCRGAQRQHARQAVPDPARIPRIQHRREAFQQVPARRRSQRGSTADQLCQGILSGGRHGHARLDGQRGLPAEKRYRQSLVLAGAPLHSPQRHAQHQHRDAIAARTPQASLSVHGKRGFLLATRTQLSYAM